MRLKSYFASTVEEAISLASRELGEDAMLVYSRETMPEARNLGRYEVVFALEAGVAPTPESSAEPGSTGPAFAPVSHGAPESGSALRDLRTDILEMKRQFSRMERLLVHAAGAMGANRWGDECERLFQELLAQEFPADLAASLISAAERLSPNGVPGQRDAVELELSSQMAALQFGHSAFGSGRVHAFIGPPGGGKTTMLVKLAVLLGMEERVPVMLVSLDARRIGGADQLKTFAHILGVPAVSIDHRAGLERLLDTEGRRHMLFLDTPGFSAEDLAEQAWLPGALRTNEAIATHLVLPAYARARECVRMIRRYESFRPASLMLTHADESESLGGVLGEALRCRLPVSYCGTGQSIPEDIRAAEPEWLARRALSAMENSTAGRSGEANWAVA